MYSDVRVCGNNVFTCLGPRKQMKGNMFSYVPFHLDTNHPARIRTQYCAHNTEYTGLLPNLLFESSCGGRGPGVEENRFKRLEV
jgi:hypothetical protein